MTKLVVGAPSLTGVDASVVAREEFAGVEFPAVLQFTNLTIRPQQYSEIGVYLLGVGYDESVIQAKIKDFDSFVRAVSSMEAIAELFQSDAVVEISTLDEIIDEEVVGDEETSELDDESNGDDESDAAKAVWFLEQVVEGVHDALEDLSEQVDQAVAHIEAEPALRKKTLIANARKHVEKLVKSTDGQ